MKFGTLTSHVYVFEKYSLAILIFSQIQLMRAYKPHAYKNMYTCFCNDLNTISPYLPNILFIENAFCNKKYKYLSSILFIFSISGSKDFKDAEMDSIKVAT